MRAGSKRGINLSRDADDCDPGDPPLSSNGGPRTGGLTMPRSMSSLNVLHEEENEHYNSVEITTNAATDQSLGYEQIHEHAIDLSDPLITSAMAASHVQSSHKFETTIVSNTGTFGKRPLTRELSLSNFLLTSSKTAPGSRSGGVGILRKDEGDDDSIEESATEGTNLADSSTLSLSSLKNVKIQDVDSESDTDTEDEAEAIIKPSQMASMRVTGHYDNTADAHSSYHSTFYESSKPSSTTNSRVGTVDSKYSEDHAQFDYTAEDNASLGDIHNINNKIANVPHRRRAMMVGRGTTHDHQSEHGQDGAHVADSSTGVQTNAAATESTFAPQVSQMVIDAHYRNRDDGGLTPLQISRNEARAAVLYEEFRPSPSKEQNKSLYGVNRYASHKVRQKEADKLANAPVATNTLNNRNDIHSRDIGKGVAVPQLSSTGIMPIKTKMNEFGDSNTHLMYLRYFIVSVLGFFYRCLGL